MEVGEPQVRIRDLCKGGQARFYQHRAAESRAAAKIWASKLGSGGGGGPGPPSRSAPVGGGVGGSLSNYNNQKVAAYLLTLNFEIQFEYSLFHLVLFPQV